MILAAFAFEVLRFMPASARRAPWLAAIGVGVASTMAFPEGPQWLVLLVAVGAAIHIAEDMLTKEGCNLVWPATLKAPPWVKNTPVLSAMWGSNGCFSIPLLGSANSVRCWAVSIPISAWAVVGMLASVSALSTDAWATVTGAS